MRKAQGRDPFAERDRQRQEQQAAIEGTSTGETARRKPGPPPGEPKRLMGIKLPVALADRLKAYCAKHHEAINAFVARAIEREIERKR